MNILLIKELVNKDGSTIGGDYKIDQDDSMTTSPTSPPVTTDDFVKSTRQGISRYMYRGFGEDDESNDDVELPEEDKELNKKKPNKKKPNKLKKSLRKESRDRMDSVVEDIFKRSDFDSDFVSKYKNSQSAINGIPELEHIRETNPILIRKVAALKDIIEKNDATGEEKGIILNHLLGIDMTDIPQSYKSELKKKIR